MPFMRKVYATHGDVMEGVIMKRTHDDGGAAERRAQRRRAAMRAFMDAYDMTPTEWARQAQLSTANILYNFLSGRSQSLAHGTLERLARAVPGATVRQILGEEPDPRPLNVAVLPVRVTAAAEAWRASYEAPQAREVQIAMPPKLPADEVALIADDHAGQIYPLGSYVTTQNFASMPRPLRHGDMVLVHRLRDGKHEVTVREVRVVNEVGVEQAKLLFRANHPFLKNVIPMPWPYEGQVFQVDGDRVQIRGRVVMMTILPDTMD